MTYLVTISSIHYWVLKQGKSKVHMSDLTHGNIKTDKINTLERLYIVYNMKLPKSIWYMMTEGIYDLKKNDNLNISYTLTIEVVDKNIKEKKSY